MLSATRKSARIKDSRMGKGEVVETDDGGSPICGRWDRWDRTHCHEPPGYGTGHEGEGACLKHGGRRIPEKGKPGNADAMKTGAHIHPSKYFEHQELPQQIYIVDIYDQYMRDAPFGYGNVALGGEVWLIAIDRHKRLRMNDVIDDEGVMTKEENVAPDGSVYYKDREHPLHLAYHRLQRDTMDALKKMGILDAMSETQSASDGEMTVEVSIHSVDAADSEDIDVETE